MSHGRGVDFGKGIFAATNEHTDGAAEKFYIVSEAGESDGRCGSGDDVVNNDGDEDIHVSHGLSVIEGGSGLDNRNCKDGERCEKEIMQEHEDEKRVHKERLMDEGRDATATCGKATGRRAAQRGV